MCGPRWPVVLTVLAVTILLTLLPQRLRLFPQWLSYAIAAAVLTPILGVPLARDRARWQRFENRLTLLFCTFMIAGTLMNLANLIGAMKLVEEMGPDAVVVTVLSDCNKKYLSTSLANVEPPQEGYITPQVRVQSFASVR